MKLLANDILGTDKITPPFGAGSWETGLTGFINRGFRLAFVAFGLYALLNFVLAAYNYINSQGETKNIEKAQKMITQSIIGLFLMSMTFVIAGVIGTVFFGDWDALLDLTQQIQNITNP